LLKIGNLYRFDLGFVTPFDPRIEVRSGNFGPFKSHILSLAEKSEDEARKEILSKKHLYSSPRTVFTVDDIAKYFGLERL